MAGERMVSKNDGSPALEQLKYSALPQNIFQLAADNKETIKDSISLEDNSQVASKEQKKGEIPGMGMSVAQLKISKTVDDIAYALSRAMEVVLVMSEWYLEDDQIKVTDIMEPDELVATKHYAIESTVSTGESSRFREKALMLLMQNAVALKDELAPGTLKQIAIKQLEIQEEWDLARENQDYVREPSKVEQAQETAMIQKMMLENKKLQAEIEDIGVRQFASGQRANNEARKIEVDAQNIEAKTMKTKMEAQEKQISNAFMTLDRTKKSKDGFTDGKDKEFTN